MELAERGVELFRLEGTLAFMLRRALGAAAQVQDEEQTGDDGQGYSGDKHGTQRQLTQRTLALSRKQLARPFRSEDNN
jgi:hypothetical protein